MVWDGDGAWVLWLGVLEFRPRMRVGDLKFKWRLDRGLRESGFGQVVVVLEMVMMEKKTMNNTWRRGWWAFDTS